MKNPKKQTRDVAKLVQFNLSHGCLAAFCTAHSGLGTRVASPSGNKGLSFYQILSNLIEFSVLFRRPGKSQGMRYKHYVPKKKHVFLSTFCG